MYNTYLPTYQLDREPQSGLHRAWRGDPRGDGRQAHGREASQRDIRLPMLYLPLDVTSLLFRVNKQMEQTHPLLPSRDWRRPAPDSPINTTTSFQSPRLSYQHTYKPEVLPNRVLRVKHN